MVRTAGPAGVRRGPVQSAAVAMAVLAAAVGLTAGPAAANDPGAGISQVKLSLRDDPATSVVITWRDGPEAGAGSVLAVPPGVDFGRCGSAGSACRVQPASRIVLTTSEGPAYAYYSAALTGLRPATTYLYRVADGGPTTADATFRTARADAAPFAASVVGEVHIGDRVQPGWPEPAWPLVAERLRSSGSRFVLSTGDNVNTGGLESEWERLAGPAQRLFASTPYLSAVGNHETYGGPAAGEPSPLFAVRFPQPTNGPDGTGRTFSFDYQGVHVVVLEANPTTPLASLQAQADWLDRDLAAARTRTRFQIVLTHAPPFHSKQSRVTPTYQNPEIRELFVPVMDRNGVDLVVSGHDMHYVRSAPLRGEPDPGAIPAVKPRVVPPGQGTTYVEVTSTGMSYPDLLVQPWMRVAVARTAVSLTLRFGALSIGAQAVAPDGTVIDGFSVRPVP
ncbi:MAG: metallophosphoesterase family protein [Actinobacteria bacterium]|nr:metallophosphoesterase family protein [Actinomycetota bacterium]